MAASSNPFRRGSRGWGMFFHQHHATRGENGSSWWGCLCDVCLASKKSSEREFFVPAGTHLAVSKLLRIKFHPVTFPNLTKHLHCRSHPPLKTFSFRTFTPPQKKNNLTLCESSIPRSGTHWWAVSV
jgi:hypothetical protein